MASLIEEGDFARATQLDKMGLAGLSKTLMSILKINRLNDLYEQVRDRSDEHFIDAVFSELELSYSIDEKELERLPANGPAIVVANHPFGGIDGLLLIKTLLKRRTDIRVMANFLLTKIEPINEYFLPVNPFENMQDMRSSVAGIRAGRKHLEEGGVLGIFPAGEVSTFNWRTRRVTDRLWQNGVLRFIKNSKVPVVPVYFEGNNSTMFHLLGMMNPLLRTARLPSELFNKRDKHIRVRIGRPISVEEQAEFEDISEYGRFIRAKTYLMGKHLEVRKFFRPPALLSKKQKPVEEGRDEKEMTAEIDKLREGGHLLFNFKELEVYCTTPDTIPAVLHEIGRQREITFRKIGEGTGKSIDVDEFDLNYRHLFIWDSANKKIAGAYRMGMGRDIMARFGKDGLYLNTLFRIDDHFDPILGQSIELGRSFLTQEYQLKPYSLFLLWKGILYFLLKNPQYRYLIGPVSISGEFSKLSKYLIVHFIKKYHFDHELAEHVKPRKEYRPKLSPSDLDLEIIEKSTQDDLKKLDKIIEEVEAGNFRIPALLKKYLSQNAKIIAFNIDPHFNNSLDGLVLLDLYDVPASTIKGLAREMEDDELMAKFGAMGRNTDEG